MSQARFQKQQREKARREKAAAKWARREERKAGDDGEAQAPVSAADQAVVLAKLAELHERFEAGTVTFDDFVEAKEELTAQLDVS